ncbi:integrase core domain-containing protein, partial [Streptomyces sp. NPDC056358]|uniref:integrase core domain-containing protein n=1 Tax=Streptomyces sp. NPDC056358 TaxID=3345794 RepID=UPI0035D83BFE
HHLEQRRSRFTGLLALHVHPYATLHTGEYADTRMNAHCERGIGALRREALDHLLILNKAHARRVLDVYAFHYNCHRPHQARGQLPPLAQKNPAPSTDLTAHRLLRTRVLGGVINEYG